MECDRFQMQACSREGVMMKYKYDDERLEMLEQMIEQNNLANPPSVQTRKKRRTIECTMEQFKNLVSDDLTWKQIGDMFNVSATKARKQAIELGIQKHKCHWKKVLTDNQILDVLEQYSTQSLSEIAPTLGVTASALYNRMKRKGVIQPRMRKKYRRTSNIQLPSYETMLELANSDSSWSDISKKLNINRTALCKHAKNLGIKKTRNYKRMILDQDLFKELVRQNLTWQEIASHFGVVASSAHSYAKTHGLLKERHNRTKKV